MPKVVRLVAATLLLLLVPAAGAGAQVIVRFAEDASAAERRAARAEVGAAVQATIAPRTQLLDVTDTEAAAAVRELASDPAVAWAERDGVVRAQWTPNDPSFANQWALHNTGQYAGLPGADLDMPEAWDVARGAGVLVGVVDTGVAFDHADVTGTLASNPAEIAGNGVDDDANGRVDDTDGWDFVSNDPRPADDNGHGTAVGSMINASSDNATGMASVAPDAQVVHAKVLGATGSGTKSATAAGMELLAQRGAKVINLSLGGGASLAEQDVIQRWPGVLFVVAAGNDAIDNDGPSATFPCAYPEPNVLCVGASTNLDQQASFSNWGASTVDLMAPGQTVHGVSWRHGTISTWAGTSFSSPLTAGVAALVWSHRPAATVAQVKAAVVGSGDLVPAFAPITVSGRRLNARAALDAIAAAVPAGAPSAPVSTTAPSVTAGGALQPGTTLTAADGTWTGATTLARRWQRCDGTTCSDIAGATATTYVLAAADAARTLRVVVTATGAGGEATRTSARTAVVQAAPAAPAVVAAPAVTGAARVGELLGASPGSWTGATSFAYAWQRCDVAGVSCSALPGGSTARVLAAADAGTRLRVVVTATGPGGSATAASPLTPAVAAPPALEVLLPVAAAPAELAPVRTAPAAPVAAGPAPPVVLARAVRVGRSGKVAVPVTCDRACRPAVRLSVGGKRAGSGRASGGSRLRHTIRVALSRAARAQLRRRGSLRVVAQVRANGQATTVALRLRG